MRGTYFFLGVFIFLSGQTHASVADIYQLGSNWGKIQVTEDKLEDESAEFKRAVNATVRVGRASGFYLGEFRGKKIIATNRHVVSSQRQCESRFMRFEVLDIELKCVKLLGSWKDVDLALINVQIAERHQNKEEVDRLPEVARNFSFSEELYAGQELITVGFGKHRNPRGKLVANQDSDCKVFSEEADYRFIRDPDTLNAGPNKVWSFANACDVSHGDSGSAFVDRFSGEVVGLLWTGTTPKSPRVQNSDYLDQILEEAHEDIWTELSYGVPAPMIGVVLYDWLVEDDQRLKPSIDPETKDTIYDLLESGGFKAD